MKGKRINPVERHVEKLFFLLALVILLGVLVAQFATGGMTVQVGSQDGLTIKQGYTRIATRAEQVRGQIEANELDSRAPREAPGVSGMLARLIDERQRREIATIPFGAPDGGDAMTFDGSGGEDIREGVRYAMPKQPAPTRPLTRVSSGTLDPLAVAALPELESIVPESQPFDVRFVTAAARFDAAALREAFATDPDGTGPVQPIPRHWWQGQLSLLDVELWRQEVYEDGSHGAEELLESPPGIMSLRSDLTDASERNLQSVLESASQASSAIARPSFYPMIAGPAWKPPAPPVELTPEQRDAKAKREELSRIERELEDLRDDLDAVRNADQRSRRSNDTSWTDGVQAGIGGGGRGRGGGQRDSGPSQAERQRAAKERRLSAIQDRIDRKQQERDTMLSWFSERGLSPEIVVEVDPGLELLRSPVGSLKDSDTISVWAHDISAEPGATYRYRMRLVYANPFYGRENVIHESQREALAGDRVIRSSFSPWSAPETVDRSSYFFLTRASTERGIGGGRSEGVAAAELYTFYYGYWRQTEVRLRAGDPVVGEFSLPAMDIYPVVEGEDGLNGGASSFETVPSPATLTRSMGSTLLDVRESARVRRDALRGVREEGADFEAVILGPEDVIEVRNPEVDRSSDRRGRLLASVEAGREAVPVQPGSGGVLPGAAENQKTPRSDQRDERERDSRF